MGPLDSGTGRKPERGRAMKRLVLALLLVAVFAPLAMAGQVMVQNMGTGPGVTLTVHTPPPLNYNGGAYVGVENLLVDGVAYKGFCIDLYNFSSGSPLLYDMVALMNSPGVPPGAMGAAKADFIKEMWAHGYAIALTGNNEAAGFQLAIWGVLQGTISGGVSTANWSWLEGGATTAAAYGADDLIDWTNTNDGGLANVVGLNRVNPPGGAQSYAIQVPDGGATLALLGFALMGLGALRRKFNG
jgi:hypothetical protein